MTKKKLVSVLLAAVLLISCVAGVLITGAGAEVLEPTVIYTVADYEEEGAPHFTGFSAALQEAAKQPWGKDDVLEIRFQGEQVSAGAQGTFDSEGNIDSTGTQGLLFGQTTIWREDGTKLPITIRGIDMNESRDSWIYIDSAGGWYACANDYTFVNLTMPIGNYGTQFFAGSGNVTFQECNLNFTTSSRIVIHNMEEWQEKSLISTDLSEYIAKKYDVDIIPVNNAAQLAVQSEAFGDETLGHLLYAAQRDAGLDYGDWTHEGDIGGGQYLYACVLFETLTRMSCIGNTFRPTYGLKYDDMTFEELQEIAHAAVEEQYGEGYCTGEMPEDVGDDGIYNVLLVGSSNAYYCIDELASVARAAGVNMKVYHAYTSSIPMVDIASGIENGTGNYSVQIWYDSDGKGAVKTSEMSSLKTLADIVPALTWDGVATFETSGKIDDFGLDPDNHEAQMEQVIAACAGAETVYNFLRENCDPDTRMLWYETATSPIGAYGSTTTLKGYLFGDNCTDAAFIGWDRYEGETIQTGITIGDNVTYIDTTNKAAIKVAASGYLLGQTDTALTDETAANITYHASGAEGTVDIRPIQVEPCITIDGDGAALYNVGTKIGGSPCNATVHLKKGAVNMICGDNNTNQSGDEDGNGERFYGDMNVLVTGGSLLNVNLITDSHVQGDLNLTVKPTDGEISIGGYLRGLFGAGTDPGSCTGDTTFDIQDVYVTGSIHAGGSDGKVVNFVKNVTMGTSGSYVGARFGTPVSITNTLENVTLEGSTSSYMGAYQTQVNGNITNYVTDCNFACSVYGGSRRGNLMGSVKNILKDSTFTGKWFVAGGENAPFVENDDVTYRIENEIDGCSFIRYVGGGDTAAATVAGAVKNTFKGAESTFTTGLYCASNSAGTTKVENYFTSKISGSPFGGSNIGKVDRIENYIKSGAEIATFYGSCNTGSATLTKTEISGGTVATFSGGIRDKTLTGDIENTVKGDAVVTTFYGGGTNAATGVQIGNVKNTIEGNAQITTFYGAANTSTLAGNVENTVLGGKITGFYGGANTGTVGREDDTATADVDEYVKGSVTNYILGGQQITTYRGGSKNGNITGDVTNNFGSPEDDSLKATLFGFVGGNQEGGVVAGKIENNYYNVDVTATFYGGMRYGTVTAVVNNVYDGFTFNQSTAYLGGNATKTGASLGITKQSITNNIYGGNFAVKNSTIYAGNNTATFEENSSVAYRIQNNIYGGTLFNFRVASASGKVAGNVDTNIYGGTIKGTVENTNDNITGANTVDLLATTQMHDPIVLLGTVALDTLTVEGETVVLGESSTVTVKETGGKVIFHQSENWVADHNYVTLPEGNAAQVIVTTASGAAGTWVTEMGSNDEVLVLKGSDIQKSAAETPSAPTPLSKTDTMVVLVEEEGFEYSLDGENWQMSGTFEGLTPATAYTFYRRTMETSTHLASRASEALSVTTDEEPPYLLGDVDNSGTVNSDDAIYLLYHTLYENDYPVNQPVDFNGDGSINSDDAIYLLYHTLYENDYPLKSGN